AMNLMLLKSDSIENNVAKISGRQLDHLTQVQRLTEGDFLNLGEINGTMGRGKINTLTDEHATISLELGAQPPKPLPITVSMLKANFMFLWRPARVRWLQVTTVERA
ncbi:hypothetical protein OAN63_02885, partial [Porticoccaceae bacterium]|nr:hypothetical protein [Porticoccaceae bacterium]